MEWYQEWSQQHNQKYYEKHRNFYAEPSIEFIEPFAIADDFYYVGDKLVCVHMIKTDEGLILLDAGYPCTRHLLMTSILRLGFQPKDVKWIILTHGHFDHFGASNEFRNLFGTKVAISAADAQSIRENPKRATGGRDVDPPVIDRELQDGEIFSFGGKEIRCVLTPGHTVGTMAFFFDVTYEGKTYLAGTIGGVGMTSMRLPYLLNSELPLDLPQRMLKSLELVENEPVVVHFANHPYNSHTLEKREQQLREGGNPFIAPDSWKAFIEDTRKKTLKLIRENAELAQQHQIEM